MGGFRPASDTATMRRRTIVHQMIQPDIYWLRDAKHIRLAIMPRPRSGEWLADEIMGLHRAGLKTIVSVLESFESQELGLQQEEALCKESGMDFISFQIPDRGVPASSADFAALVDSLAAKLSNGNSVGIHCRAGIGRSGLLAACVLGRLGIAPDRAFAMLTRARGVAVPDTEAQTAWVHNFARSHSRIR